MVTKKERPRCRKEIDNLVKSGFSLEEIARGYIIIDSKSKCFFSKGMNLQAKKMLDERRK